MTAAFSNSELDVLLIQHKSVMNRVMRRQIGRHHSLQILSMPFVFVYLDSTPLI
jgi:hypothetical protein